MAYGANNAFAYLYNQTGTITFNNTTFGDPAPGVVKSGYYKLASSEGNAALLEMALQQLQDHCTSTNLLTGQQINDLSDSIQLNIFSIADTSSLILQALDLIACYETQKGPLFLNPATLGGFQNDFDALDGKELDRAVFVVQQGMFDHVYTPVNVAKYAPLLTNRRYLTADYFPGVCPDPTDSSTTYTATVNASLPTEYGSGTAFSASPARRPTGYYLAPGSMGTVLVPPALVNKGFKILVGAHSVNRTAHNPVNRFFRVTNSFPIDDTLTRIVNPFGGGIYIITPYEAAEGLVDIQLTNVVPAPYFAANTASKISLQDWQETQRNNPAPWADFVSDKYMMQVPTSWIYNYDDPVTLMQDWDDRMDVVSRLLGYPLMPNNIKLYLQVDVGIQYLGFYGIGNPQVNNTYNPLAVENGNKNHWFLRPGDGFWETEFHEMGHAQLFSNFPGETEASVNVLAAAIFNRLYGMDIDMALGRSFDDAPYRTRDQSALNWMVTPNFRAGKAMDISNTTKDEVRYQQRGYAKYIEMAALFGWEMIDSFYNREQLDFIQQVPGDGLTDVDSRILRFSRTAGADVRPLIHFWGVHPKNPAVLADAISTEGLSPSKLICDRLVHYKSIIPLNNAEFEAHAKAFFGGSVPAGGHPDYGSGWYNIWLTQYDETHGALAQESMQNIIDLYFPGGCPTEVVTPNVTVNSITICAGDSATLTATGAMYYEWSNGATGPTITVIPDTTTTYTVIGKTAGINSSPALAQVTVIPVPEVSVDDVTICEGQSVTLLASGAESWLWSTGDTSELVLVAPSITTTYSVVGTTAGCESDSISVEVTVVPLPTVTITEDPQGPMTILDAGGQNLTYLWSTGEITPSIQVDSSGTYTVTVTDAFGCSNSASITITITSIFDQENGLNILIAPNPVREVLHITCTGQATTSVRIIDNLGRVVLEDRVVVPDGATRTVNMVPLPAGTYSIQITGMHLVKTARIVK